MSSLAIESRRWQPIITDTSNCSTEFRALEPSCTVNPRLFEDQIAYICQHAEDCILCFDPPFAELVARLAPHLRSTRRYVVLGDPADADEIRAALPSGMDVTDYETLIGAEDDAYAWPVFDEQTASSLCEVCGSLIFFHSSVLYLTPPNIGSLRPTA